MTSNKPHPSPLPFTVESVNISEKKGTRKHPVKAILCIENHGIQGDAHAGPGHRQVSLLAAEAIETMQDRARAQKNAMEIHFGDFAENIVTRGIDWTTARVGATISINDVILEITQIGKECHTGCAISKTVGDCIMPKQGIFARVIKGGKIHAGNNGHYSF